MDRRVAVAFGLTGQTVEFYPPEATEGVPSAATCSVYQGSLSDDDLPEFSPAVTIDATSLALSGSSGHFQHGGTGGRKRIWLASTAGLAARRRYLLQNAISQREVVRLVEVSASGTIYATAEYDLAYDYPLTTSSLLGLRMTFPVDATWVANEAKLNHPGEPYRVLWSYTVGGVARRHWTQIDLVRAPKQHGVTADSLLGDWPTLLYQLGEEERATDADRAIRAASDRVFLDLELAGVDPNSLRDSGKLDMLVKMAALEVFARSGTCPPNRDIEQWVRETSAIYKRDLEKMLGGNVLVRSEGTGGGITPDPIRAGWFLS